MSGERREIVINPVTRLEGHAKIHIFLNSEGDVDDVYFQVTELRGFERFCRGRPAEEMPRITPMICGVCPTPHHLASAKAVDCLFGVEATETAKKLRELSLCAHQIHSHTTHFYALAGPDYIIGSKVKPKERNIIGLLNKVGEKLASQVIKARAHAQKIQETIGGRATHPVNNLPGGLAKPITEEQRKEILEQSIFLEDFAESTLEVFRKHVLNNRDHIASAEDLCRHKLYHMGTVDGKNRTAFYEGEIRVVSPEGREYMKFPSSRYLEQVAEHVEPWSYLKFTYLKNKGWRGLVEGPDSGIYCVGPLSRLNVAEGMATPKADHLYNEMYETLGEKPVHNALAMNWARVVEIMYAAERIRELAEDPSITDIDVRNIPTDVVGEGVGHVEAPRGTLIHHYWCDEEGFITKVNLLVATGNNNAAICMSVKNAAKKLVKNFKTDEGILNVIEMAFRAYDPCFACATHALPGHMPLEVIVYNQDREICRRFSRNA